ncbi:hypothetical protein, partial [Streptomyces europaeiscabiei]|uniref:hypothetical protein n=1 Tax=Streptomyces europaeiscabiei TaxID=146819 RepID=UPI0038F62182
DGITLYLAAGSAANGTTNLGGTLWLFGGAGYSGAGGDLKLQAGTSLNATGGNVYVMGGNSTNGAAGNVDIIAGTTGQSGGNVKIYATNLQNVAGD